MSIVKQGNIGLSAEEGSGFVESSQVICRLYQKTSQISEKRFRQEEVEKLQGQAGYLTDAQWKSREEKLQKETLQQIERQKSQLQQRQIEVAEKLKRQTEMSKQLEEKCKSLKNLESKRLTELRNQLQEKQLETEQAWSNLTNTWAAENITKDSKIDEITVALQIAREQQLASEQAWKTAIEEEKTEKLGQVNKLIERVKGMECQAT